MAPITLGIQIPKEETLLLAQRDICRSPGDLPRHERSPTPRTLMIEQNPIARVDVVRLAVIDNNPVGVQLGDTIR